MIDIIAVNKEDDSDILVIVDYIPFHLKLERVGPIPGRGVCFKQLNANIDRTKYDYGHFSSRYSDNVLHIIKNTVRYDVQQQLQFYVKQGLTVQEINNFLKNLYLKELVKDRIIH